jgi:hypothetical protein
VGEAPIELVLRVDGGPDSDPEENAELALRLRDELRETDAASVKLGRGEDAPAGAKSGDPVELGTLLVGVVSSGALTAVLTTANSWIARQKRGRVHVKLGGDELLLSGMPSEDQQRLIDHWLARQSPEPTDA